MLKRSHIVGYLYDVVKWNAGGFLQLEEE